MSDPNAAGATNQPAGEPSGVEGEQKPNAGVGGSNEPNTKAAEGEPKGDDKAVEYAFEFPEGFQVNDAELNEFKAVAKELKLDADGAKKLAGLRVKYAQAQAEAHEAEVAKWAASAEADKEYGGDKFEENMGVATQAFEAVASPELKEFFKKTRLGNHPEIVRAFYRVGKQISPDGFVRTGATTGRRPTEDVLYGSSAS